MYCASLKTFTLDFLSKPCWWARPIQLILDNIFFKTTEKSLSPYLFSITMNVHRLSWEFNRQRWASASFGWTVPVLKMSCIQMLVRTRRCGGSSKPTSVTLGLVMLLRLIYAVNLSYRKDLTSTLEVFQKILMELDTAFPII